MFSTHLPKNLKTCLFWSLWRLFKTFTLTFRIFCNKTHLNIVIYEIVGQKVHLHVLIWKIQPGYDSIYDQNGLFLHLWYHDSCLWHHWHASCNHGYDGHSFDFKKWCHKYMPDTCFGLLNTLSVAIYPPPCWKSKNGGLHRNAPFENKQKV